MPKIIENLEGRLLEEAKKQIEEGGYGAVTIRSIATGCGVGVGTVYNYFPSKDNLVATYLLQDWNLCIQTIHMVAAEEKQPKPVVRCMYDQLIGFSCRHRGIFQDPSAASGFAGSFNQYHSLLRHQLAQPLLSYCDSEFTALFAAESLLSWTMCGKAFEELYRVLEKLFV